MAQRQVGVADLQATERETPLKGRIKTAPQSLLSRFEDDLHVKLSPHPVTPSERLILAEALAQLAPLQRQVLERHLHAIYFIDGLPNNALTFPEEGKATETMYSIAVRAGALHETVSELVTRKERTLFDTTGSDMSVTVNAGHLNAMVYVMLHEGTHIVDFSVGATPDAAHRAGDYPLVSSVWRDPHTPVDEYRQPILMNIFWRTGRTLPVAEAADLYDALGRTPFISVYASCDSHDDLAELLAWPELTARLQQPYRILISKGENVIRVVEPAKSRLVKARVKYLRPLTGS